MNATLLVVATLGGVGVTRVVDTFKEVSPWEFHPAVRSLVANLVALAYALAVVLLSDWGWASFLIIWFGTMGIALGFHDLNTLTKMYTDKALADVLRRRGPRE